MKEKEEINKQIKCVEENIKLKESLGKDASSEKSLVKAWKQWLKNNPKPMQDTLGCKKKGFKD